MSNRTVTLDDRLYDYLLRYSLRETPVMRQLREMTADHEHARMQIAPEQGQFMALLVELMGARQIIEVGTFTGYSALCMAQSLPEDGRLVCCDVSREWTDVGIPFWERAGVRERIDLRIAPALQTLDTLIAAGGGDSYDLAFIDADKTNYRNYFERCLRLVRPGGLLMFDNTLWGGAVADPEDHDEDTLALRTLNELLLVDQRVSVSLVPIGDGLTLARKR
ncbi:MAG: class I SAM-dependent methyltransferase [Chromatiaceae bacterium]|nr:class I SAM-dependent methyltransferase [Chromatiaceae bacterium]MCP5315775.1 class I SAM-dependent methyltransferase [Chromatiaceae bacterium]